MELSKFIELIQVQRHDFLNHLQVISGLTQLNKIDRVREYISRISMEIAEMSQTARVKIPEVTAVLLAGFNDASMSQVELKLSVNSSLSGCAVPGPVAGAALERALTCAIEAVAPPGTGKNRLEVLLSESDKKYTCRLLLPEHPTGDTGSLEERLAPIGELLCPHGGRINLALANNGLEIFLIFPRKEGKSG